MISVSLIVAVAKNAVIGLDNQLPWHIPEDLKWFKQNTMGKPMIMGRKTFESLGRPLPGRPHIVLTRDESFSYEGVHVVHTVESALELARSLAEAQQLSEIMVIGGANIYQQMLPLVSKIYRTLVDLEPDGDAFFHLEEGQWEVVQETKKTSKGGYFFLTQVLEKLS